MRMWIVWCGMLLCAGGLSQIQAGEYNNVMNIGDVAPAWTDLPGVDEKKHSLADLKNKPLVVVIFTCNSCPIATDYEERINTIAQKNAEAVAVVAINVNTIPEDSLPKMQERAKEKKFAFTYLYDESQKIGKAYGAAFTPECFVLNKDRQIIYMGGIDDNSDPAAVKERYLEQAITAGLKGEKPKTAESTSIGCRIRYVSERRKKK